MTDMGEVPWDETSEGQTVIAVESPTIAPEKVSKLLLSSMGGQELKITTASTEGNKLINF